MRIIRRLLKDKKGSAIVQTALMIPILLGLFFGLVWFANALRYKMILSQAAKEGAREYQITGGNMGNVNEKVDAELALGLVEGAVTSVEGSTIVVTKPYGFYVPVAGEYMLTLKGTYEFMNELPARYYLKPWNY